MKRTYKHWSFRYIKNRLKLYVWEKRKPNLPWINRNAIEILDKLLKKSDSIIEFGSGRSSLYFSKRAKVVTSLETDIYWFEKVNQLLINNTTLLLLETEKQMGSFINSLSENSIDVAFIDGYYRDMCANSILCKIKSGGLIIIDDANGFLVNPGTSSPNSLRSYGEMTDEWRTFHQAIDSRRTI